MNEFQVGEIVRDASPAAKLGTDSKTGRIVCLVRPDPELDARALFEATHQGAVDPGQWKYMAFGPFESTQSMQKWMQGIGGPSDPLYFVVRTLTDSLPVGMVSFCSIRPEHRCLELGNIWYTPAVRRTSINTETIYLMLKEGFDALGYRRIEWKCDALNARSMAAATRLGFSFEGTFKQHLIVRGRNRDTAWFAMLDSDWPKLRDNFEAVLYDPDCADSLSMLNAPRVRARP